MANLSTATSRPQDWLNLVLAACLFISPWIVGFAAVTYPAWNAWIASLNLPARLHRSPSSNCSSELAGLRAARAA